MQAITRAFKWATATKLRAIVSGVVVLLAVTVVWRLIAGIPLWG